MGEPEAYAAFKAIRFEANGGEPECPRCGCQACYTLSRVKLVSQTFRCKRCRKEFTCTSGTIFNSRKLEFGEILMAVLFFVNGVSGVSASRASRECAISYKSAFVLLHKLRQALGTIQLDRLLTGIVEIDGTHTGGHIKKSNLVKNRVDLRASNPKRQVVVTLRERRLGGRSLRKVFKNEAESIGFIRQNVHPEARVRTDEGTAFKKLRRWFPHARRVNHKSHGYSIDGIHTNGVESSHLRLKHAAKGVHHRISGDLLMNYADEITFREDYRRTDNGRQFVMLMHLAVQQPVSRRWNAYWQKRGAN